MKTYWILISALVLSAPAQLTSAETARGVVYHDLNGDGARNANEPGLGGVRVSNCVEVVVTDPDGSYELGVDDDTILFVAKPRGWQTRVDARNLPRFYYIHKPNGSPDEGFKYAGVEPTGPLPESVDFPLTPASEPDDFVAIFIGDPQPYTREEVRFYANDIIAELVDKKAAFGMSMGDIVGDDLALFEHMNGVQATVGTPWYNVYGNHDMNYLSPDDKHADETFERIYGPTDYAFQYGSVHFIVMDNVVYKGVARDGAGKARDGGYTGGLSKQQLDFVKNYAATVPKNERIVICTHIPLINPDEVQHGTPEVTELLEILGDHPHTLSFSAHTHYQRTDLVHSQEGATGATHHTHHGHAHHNIVTGSGSWYRGARDETGLPMSPMRDGVPNGYILATFSGADYSIRYKAARMPADYQLAIHTQEVIPASDSASTAVLANVFNGSELSKVQMRVRDHGDWVEMEQKPQFWPPYVEAYQREMAQKDRTYRALPDPVPTPHIWEANLPAGLHPGFHVLEVETTDMFGQTDRGLRLIEVE